MKAFPTSVAVPFIVSVCMNVCIQTLASSLCLLASVFSLSVCFGAWLSVFVFQPFHVFFLNVCVYFFSVCVCALTSYSPHFPSMDSHTHARTHACAVPLLLTGRALCNHLY